MCVRDVRWRLIEGRSSKSRVEAVRFLLFGGGGFMEVGVFGESL